MKTFNMKLENPAYVRIGAWKDVHPEEVMLLVADINYTKIYFQNGKKLTVAIPLKELGSRFSTAQFFRTHKSSIVNLNCVEEYNYNTLRLTNNLRINLARRRRTAFKQIWNGEIKPY
ncbi:MAG: LytTR family DNA-binding domain-containing protein [Bacteroidota bacterium]